MVFEPVKKMFRVFNFCVLCFAFLGENREFFVTHSSHTTRHTKNSTMSSALRRTIRGRIKRVFFSRCHILVVFFFLLSRILVVFFFFFF